LEIGIYLELACLPVGREFGDWDLTNNPYSRVVCKIEKDVTHLQ
jgi:hypothetical protein